MRKALSVIIIWLSFNIMTAAQEAPKREFRGAWIQTIYQDEYARMSVEELKADFLAKLDALQSLGINAVIFQVRPEADAWYASELEPWSRFLTGAQGKAPEPFFDPMAFLVKECHRRGMEFHAWLNPFRAGTAGAGRRTLETCSGFGGNAAAMPRPTAARTMMSTTVPTSTQPTTPQLAAHRKG